MTGRFAFSAVQLDTPMRPLVGTEVEGIVMADSLDQAFHRVYLDLVGEPTLTPSRQYWPAYRIKVLYGGTWHTRRVSVELEPVLHQTPVGGL
jgi:hypothetical protein